MNALAAIDVGLGISLAVIAYEPQRTAVSAPTFAARDRKNRVSHRSGYNAETRSDLTEDCHNRVVLEALGLKRAKHLTRVVVRL